MITTIIFDLDGTLVDSFPGIRLGLNLALDELGQPPRDLDWVRRHVGRGARRLADEAAAGAIDCELLLERFRHHYGEVMTSHTAPFDGVDAALAELARNHSLAVASNKPLSKWCQNGARFIHSAILDGVALGIHDAESAESLRRGWALPRLQSGHTW
jgi:phosphoglycolate phosphatase-like HAD superfamily hydrolase